MRAICVIVLEAGTYQSAEMALAEDNDVLEELASAAADPAFSQGQRYAVRVGLVPMGLTNRTFFSAATCYLNAKFSIMSFSRVRKIALSASTLSATRKMRRRNMAAELAFPVPGSQAPPLGTSFRLTFQSKPLILLVDE